jgi:hypothetical protein
MADDTQKHMAATARHVYGPRPLSAVLPDVLRPAFRKQPAALAQVILDWHNLVGPSLSPLTAPKALRAGTLTIGCAGPTALELQHSAPHLIERLNTQLGHNVVKRLRFVHQDVRSPAPVMPSRRRPPPSEAPIAAKLADLPAGPLRDALLALGKAVGSTSQGE